MVIVDTGFWLALGSAKDKHHARAVKVLASIREPLVTTWRVLIETCHLLVQRRFLAGYVQGAFHIHEIGDEQIRESSNSWTNTLTCRWIWRTRRWSFCAVRPNGRKERCRIVTVLDNLGRFGNRQPFDFCSKFYGAG
jgi:hypothetical protein